MFKDDDDKDEGSAFGITRYPCMPSLVALQQMRNRLHLAFLGKKLMKWTALATGREMRRLAQELYDVYAGFGEDLRNAFILLARCRYFYPPLNGIVLEDIGLKAGVIVQQCSKTISGVKIVQFDIYETEHPPYPHLGLEKGGQTIMETKKAWLELLKRLIMMMQLRASFLMVELAHKNANKKMNVLKRITIPRINLTVAYILTELEEIDREEFHRLKKVKEKKKRDYDLRNKKPEKVSSVCEMCVAEKAEIQALKAKTEIIKEPSEMIQSIPIIAITPESAAKVEADAPTVSIAQKEPEPFVKLSTTPSTQSPRIETEAGEDNRLTSLKNHLNELIALGKELLQAGVDDINIDDFLNMCEGAKLKLDQFFMVEEYSEVVDEKLERKLEHLKRLIREVIDITKGLKPDAKLTSSVENFIKMCENVDEKLDIYKQGASELKKDNELVQLEEFKDIITNVENVTKEYNEQGLLSPSAEAFLQSCREMKSKLDKYMDDQKTKAISVEPSTEQPGVQQTPIEHLIKHVDDTIDLGIEAREEGLISDSVERFIRSFDEIKSRVMQNEEKNVIQNLQLNIDEIINLIKKLKADGLLTASVGDLLKFCEETKNKIDNNQGTASSLYDNYSNEDLEDCVGTCLTNIDSQESLNNYSRNILDVERPLLIDEAPCASCTGSVVLMRDTPSEFLCTTCSQPVEAAEEEEEKDVDTIGSQTQTILTSSNPSVLQRAASEDKQAITENKAEPSPSVVDNNLGYFKKEIKKKVRVTRTRAKDGTIWEQKETITTRKEKHDPNAQDDDDSSDEDDIREQVNICLLPNDIQRGFIRNIRKTLSESFCKQTPSPKPFLRKCLSADNFLVELMTPTDMKNSETEIDLDDIDIF